MKLAVGFTISGTEKSWYFLKIWHKVRPMVMALQIAIFLIKLKMTNMMVEVDSGPETLCRIT